MPSGAVPRASGLRIVLATKATKRGQRKESCPSLHVPSRFLKGHAGGHTPLQRRRWLKQPPDEQL